MTSRIQELTPNLRFPGFSGEWQAEKLDDMLRLVVDNRGKTPPVQSSGIPLIETNAIGDYDINYSVIKKFVSENTFGNWFRKHVRHGDVLFSTVGQTGLASIYKGDRKAAIAQNIVGLRANDETDGDFLYYLLIQDVNNHQFKKIEMIAVQPSVKVSQMIHLQFRIPEIEEQQKIAGFLTAVDEKIAATDKKVELLKKYKKGIMQKIFTQKIRFKDENSRDYPDWQFKKADELFTNVSDRNHRGDLPVLSATQDSGIVVRDTLDRKINQSEAGIQNYKIIRPNDFVISLRSFQGGIEMSHVLGISSPAYTVIRGNNYIHPDMYRYYFKRDAFISRLNSTVIGIRDGKQISYGPFSTLKLPVPHINEQQKIADFLTAIDDKIQLEESKLSQAKKFKKFLMQRMFV